MRRVVRSVSSNVQLPVLPEARMDIRIGMRLPSVRAAAFAPLSRHAKDHGKLAGSRQSLNGANLEGKLFRRQPEPIEGAHHRRGQASRLK